MQFFLKVKAWQLFLLICVLPFGLQFLLVKVLASVSDPNAVFIVMPLFMMIFMVILLGWFLTLGVQINKVVPFNIRMTAGYFKFGIYYSLIYMFLFFVEVIFTSTGGAGVTFSFILPFHLFATTCMFYGLYFVSKNLVMAEKKQKVVLVDYVGTFLLIWFFPIGVWFVQPRVNKLFVD